MRVSDTQSGRVYTVEVEQCDRTPFQGRDVLAVNNEVFFYQSEKTGEILLRHATEDVWDIRGTDKKNKSILQGIIERNLPRLSWVASVRPKKSPEILMIQVHEFPQRLQLTEEFQIGVDDKIIEDIREKHIRKNVPVDKIIEWLNGQFLLPVLNENHARRSLLQAGTSFQNGLENTFLLCGKERVINIRCQLDNKLIIEKIEKARSPKKDEQHRPVVLFEAKLSFCDISLAGTLRQPARTEIDLIVEKSNSYLKLWKEYNNLELESIVQKIQQFGWVRYNYCQILHNGNYRFQLLSEDNLEERLKMLAESQEFSLEASEQQPQFSTSESRKTKNKSFVGQLEDIDLYSLNVEIRSANPDDDLSPPPKGFLFISLQGDLTRLARRQKAEQLIRTATCPMPQLGLILENQRVPTRRTRQHKALSPDTKKVFNGSPTLRQEEALKVALNTPDIALIQGPPGTGKTKVISALQVRLAEISEDSGNSVSHRLLLTSYQHDAVENAAEKSVVFGLPAVRIGGRAKDDVKQDNVDRWLRSRIEALEAKLATFSDSPESANLRQVRNLVASYILTPGNRQETAALLKQIFELTKGKIKGDLSDRLLEYSHKLARGQNLLDTENLEERESALRAVKGIRTDPVTFSDDGPRTAMKALRRLDSLQVLETSERQLLQNAAEWIEEEAPPFLEELALLRDRLLEKLIPQAVPVTTVVADPEIEVLLNNVREAMYERVRQSSEGVEAVLSEYLEDLSTDPQGVREMLRDYTVVLAATCQQSSSKQMQRVTGDDDTVFETVIVDEAARANPLDLFIPMSKAERRIILVGDHRQLPQILEEDIERQLSQSTEATKKALKKSLFERLFVQMKELEKLDGIKRTVTLDTQYRMHPILGDFVSRTFYEFHGEPPIGAGRPEEEFIHNLPGYENVVAAWINVPLSAGKETKGRSKSRPIEAKRIAQELKKLIEHDTRFTFGIIAFYSAQVTEIWKALCEVGIAEQTDDGIYQIATAYRETRNHEGKIIERLRVGTVDAFQGKEFDIVFLSMTRSNNINANSEDLYHKKYGFLMLENRLCVAMSRQQRLLITVGDLEMVKAEAAPTAIRELVAFYELCQKSLGKII
ncbi:AAA family ATPase [Scytonema sp. UIC 10036]|uniref:DEAD/DEAH box helicase n=1 Tax=Scytonema sp. UIC 10036 TaxID=2304196 RepID=UPI0012DA2248|nr:AAA domain-containing protein [Scytonema sp. UIC 10036]MUG96348.1 AAA family ATPase [Scytonema sp. UIC 10036]